MLSDVEPYSIGELDGLGALPRPGSVRLRVERFPTIDRAAPEKCYVKRTRPGARLIGRQI